MLSQRLLDILCCPGCKGDLRYDKEKNILTCAACKKMYSIIDDIPIMLIDEEQPPA